MSLNESETTLSNDNEIQSDVTDLYSNIEESDTADASYSKVSVNNITQSDDDANVSRNEVSSDFVILE